MSILAIIPARGGSKDIPYKNIKEINGKPLIYYVVDELLKTPEVDRVVVSTDDDKIIKTVKDHFGNKVDILERPSNISGDFSTSELVIDHAIHNVKPKFGYTMLVQCTSPLTEAEDFTNLIKTVKGNDSAAYYVRNYSFCFDLDDEDLRSPRLPRQVRDYRTQEAGNAWIFKTEGFKEHKSRLFGKIDICEIDYPKNLEIDTMEDFDIIECILERRNKNG